MTLKIGSEGPMVKRLQESLGINPDGKFGNGTQKSLIEWQKKNGLDADGIAGDATLSKLGISQELIIETPSLKISALRGHIPDNVISQIPETASRFNITTNLRLSHFLAQCAHESGGFRTVFENLNYSAQGLKNIFPKYFPGSLNESYARNPERIASRVYGGRMGNGDETTGDGFKFRGRGYIQLTGKSNYQRFSEFIGDDVVSNPDLVATKYPLSSAAFFFDSNKLWQICDKGSTDDIVTLVTKRVNGGTIGLKDRIKHFREYHDLLT